MRWCRALIAIAGCGYPAIDGVIELRGRHVDLHADPTLPICRPSLAVADTFVEDVAALLDVPAADIDYELYDNRGAPGGCSTLGSPADCSLPGHVWAGTWIRYHEIVEALSDVEWGKPPAFFLEGLAEGLGTQYPQLAPDQRRSVAVEDILESTRFNSGDLDLHYATAGDFEVFLLRRYGVAKLRRLHRSVLHLADASTIRAAFVTATGESLDRAIAAWREYEPSSTDALLPLDAGRCAAPPVVVLTPDDIRGDESLACVTIVTPAGASIDQPTVHTFDVAQSGLYGFGLAVTGTVVGLSGTVRGCGNDDRLAVLAFEAPVTRVSPLQAGVHTVELVVDEPATVTWHVDRLGAESGACAGAPAYSAPAGPWSLDFSSPPQGWPGAATDPVLGPLATSWLRIDLPPSPPTVILAWQGASFGATARVRACSGSCDALSGCVELPPHAAQVSVSPVAGQPLQLEIDATASAQPLQFLVLVTP